MGQELNLDQLADAMRKQQEGETDNSNLVWDPSTMTFKELGRNEKPTPQQSPIGVISKTPYF